MRGIVILGSIFLLVLGVTVIIVSPYNVVPAFLIPAGCALMYWGRSMDRDNRQPKRIEVFNRNSVIYLSVFAICELIIAYWLKFRLEVVLFETATWIPIVAGLLRMRRN